MRDLIADNSLLLMTLSRFGMSLGFGNDMVGAVCEARGVDTPTFLAVANFASRRPWSNFAVQLPSLMAYLRGAHDYYLDFSVPRIRRELISAIDYADSGEAGLLVTNFFDEYAREVKAHMDYENSVVFGYVDGLLEGRVPHDFCIDIFAAHHDSISEKLQALKDILIRCMPGAYGDQLNATLFDLINCEEDLSMHCRLENEIFVPAVQALEEQVSQSVGDDSDSDAVADMSDRTADARIDVLSPRECEIVAMVACGKSNKEISDRLCISVHTVTTHRRNIASKLNLHSPAALTIFAIINNLVDLDEISL